MGSRTRSGDQENPDASVEITVGGLFPLRRRTSSAKCSLATRGRDQMDRAGQRPIRKAGGRSRRPAPVRAQTSSEIVVSSNPETEALLRSTLDSLSAHIAVLD